MRKRIIGQGDDGSTAGAGWLDIEQLAQLELTSEAPDHPIEAALRPGGGTGWRADTPGEQTIRLVFDEPQRITRVRLVFQEDSRQRTQEFTLGWRAQGEQGLREIVRQQYTFSPPNTSRQEETYNVELAGVTALELRIIPDISKGDARASLAELRIAGG